MYARKCAEWLCDADVRVSLYLAGEQDQDVRINAVFISISSPAASHAVYQTTTLRARGCSSYPPRNECVYMFV